MEENIHVAITRTVKPGFEEAFEKAIQDFFAKTVGHPGSLGGHLIRPASGSEKNTYGILRSFKSKNDQDAFYQSGDFLEWEKSVQHMVDGDYSRDSLHGLEAFFADPTIVNHPPKWKMAIVTWLGVFPSVFIVSELLAPYLKLPALAGTAVVTFLVVVLLSWVVMPFLTKIMRPWLKPKEA